jgi:hypothetical protein
VDEVALGWALGDEWTARKVGEWKGFIVAAAERGEVVVVSMY